MKKIFALCLSLGVAQTLIYTPGAHTISVPSAEKAPHEPTLQIFVQRCSALNALVQELTHRMHAGTLKTKYPQAYTLWLTALSAHLTHLKKMASTVTTEQNYYLIFAVHTILTNSIYRALNNKFQAIPDQLTPDLLKNTACILYESNPELASIVHDNGRLLDTTNYLLRIYGLSSLNYAYRTLCQKIQDNKLLAQAIAVVGPLFAAYKLKQKFYPAIDTAQAIILAYSAFSPQELLVELQKLTKNPYLKYVIAASCVAPYIVSKEIVCTKLEAFRNAAHLALLGNNATNNVVDILNSTMYEHEEESTIVVTHNSHTERMHELVDYTVNMEKYQRAGVRRRKTWLFAGPPGSGKTVAAKEIEAAINKYSQDTNKPCTFIEIHAEEHFDLVRAIENSLATCPMPVIIFVDEIHLAGYGLQVNGDRKLVTKLLKLFQELNTNNQQVLFIGATNHPELLAGELTQNKRLKVEAFHAPTFQERKNMLIDLCKHNAVDLTTINLDLIARLTAECSKGDITNLFEEAAAQAIFRQEIMGQEHLYKAVNTEVRKLERNNKLSPAEQAVVAAHQAGTALVHLLVNPTAILESTTIQAFPKKTQEASIFDVQKADARTDYPLIHGATFSYYENEVFQAADDNELIKQCKILLAGAEAQKILIGSTSNYRAYNYAQAYIDILAMLTGNIPLTHLSEKECELKKEQARTLLEQCKQEVSALLEANKKELAALAHALQAKTFLTRPEINDIIINAKTV